MQLKETPDLTQEFLDLSTSSSDDSAPSMTSLPTSSTSTTSPSSATLTSSLRTSGVSTLTSSPSRATSIVSLPSSTSSSSTSSSYQQYSPVQSSLFPIPPSLTSQLSRFQCLRNASSSSSSSSIVPPFPRLLSPQKSQFVLRGSVPSRNASKCLFGPSDTQQNKKDFDKLMRFTARDVDRNLLSSKPVREEGLCPGFPNAPVKRVLTPVEARAGAQTPTLKRRRTEGHLEFYFPRKKTATTLFALKECREVKDDESVWRSPKKFSNNSGQVRLIPKVTPLRRNANNARVPKEHEVSGEFDLSTTTSPSGHLDRRHVRMEWERGISLDLEESMLTSQEQEVVPAARRVPVVQLRPAAQSRQRHRSHSDSNLKKSEAEPERDGGLRRRSSSSQLCSSLEKIATFDHNNNNSNSVQSEGFKAASRRLFFQQQGSSSPCTVSSTNPELETFACLVCPSMNESTFPEMEPRPNVSPDSSMEEARLPDDPYLRLIREREILGFVPIPDRFDSREETSESLED